jgi:hypothetical protein
MAQRFRGGGGVKNSNFQMGTGPNSADPLTGARGKVVGPVRWVGPGVY